LMNSLRFGPMDGEHGARTRRIVEGVVAGIAGYGNSIGIPTVGGEIVFDESYAGNPLVNVFCLGLAGTDALVKGRADGVGNPVYYVGAKTGRDGIHGATMASAEFDDKSADKRPAVQVGDPFMEKLLLEACLELMKGDALIGVQDMGAAGLTCATSEMGARSGSGIEMDVMHVPQRETGMTPYEIMLSESQERMLLVVKKGRESDVEAIFDKWDLHAAHVGYVTGDGLLRVKDHGTAVAEIPTTALVDDAPVYHRPMARPAYLDAVQQFDAEALPEVPVQEAFFRILASPTVASKRWAYRQYDHMVRTNSIVLAGMGAAVVRVKGTSRALAMSVDGNGRYCYLDPFRGAMLAVAEAARNVACAGAQPVGATNCLNFGNPERPEIMWQFAEAVRGIGEACRALEVPITGGNVSLYNETDGKAIYPTPVLGVVGVIEDAACALARSFRSADDVVILLGDTFDELGGTEYLKTVHGAVKGQPPGLDLAKERALIELLGRAASTRLLQSAHDCSDGGIAVTLAECTFDSGGIGCDADVPAAGARLDSALFSESASRVIVSAREQQAATLLQLAAEAGVPAQVIGRTGGSRLKISVAGQPAIDCDVPDAEQRWANALGTYFQRQAS